MENLNPTASNPPHRLSMDLAIWVIDTSGLDRGKWKAIDDRIHVATARNYASGGDSGDEACVGNYIMIQNGDLIFDPSKIQDPAKWFKQWKATMQDAKRYLSKRKQ